MKVRGKATEKVLKHMKSFNLLLDRQKEKALISEKAYHTLKDYSDMLIKRLQ
ncbi:FIMAH domain-containing protein [Novibacillus thermophilus]|uniref:FIMAH domain-containing protein n=1 Tax=Novibacillus thermophilus TaxID=1471761 RepID=UPI003AAAAB43